LECAADHSDRPDVVPVVPDCVERQRDRALPLGAEPGRVPGAIFDRRTARPGGFFLAVVCVTAVVYLPLSAIYSPWKWVGIGPFEVQAAFTPQYALYFLLGLVVGAHGYEQGLLDRQGMLVRRWTRP
jgi:hypothetical protein